MTPRTLQKLRRYHFYVGVFFAPAIFFFALSGALQTFVIQLACGAGGYLPTERAVAGGGYSAVPESGRVGPEGGQVLVDRMVELMNGLWPRK